MLHRFLRDITNKTITIHKVKFVGKGKCAVLVNYVLEK